jgi:hypothetical protein
MTSSATTEIFSSHRLAGFWAFAAGDGLYLGVLERGEDGAAGTLSVGGIEGGQLRGMHVVAAVHPWVRSVSVAELGPDVIFALEVNGDQAGEIAGISSSRLVGGAAQATAELEAKGALELSPAQLARVEVPVTELWNVAGPLAPAKWVFSPSPIHGARRPEVVANSADGQAMILGSDDEEASSLAISNAAEPQAWRRGTQLNVAFLRFAEPYRPFWALSRYSGSGAPPSGALWVASGRETPKDLSATLGIGTTTAFSLGFGADGGEWLFAERTTKTATDVCGITRVNAAWEIARRWSLDCSAERIALTYAHQGWHVVASVKAPDGGRSLRYAALQ